jgi:hypothetical protein
MVKRKITWLCFFAIAAVAIWLMCPRPRDLFAHATRIPNFRTDDQVDVAGGGWETSDVLVLEYPDPVYLMPNPQWFIRINISTGSTSRFRIPMPGLTPAPGAARAQFLAPDGKHILYRTDKYFRLATYDGHVVRQWPAWGYWPSWSSDCKSWVITDLPSDDVRLYSVDSAEPSISRNLSKGAFVKWYGDDGQIGLEFSGKDNVPHVRRVALNSPSPNSAKEVQLPSDIADIAGVEPSPRRDRIAWQIARIHNGSPVLQWFLRLFGRRSRPIPTTIGAGKPPPYDSEGIWISRPDGTDMYLLGEVKSEWAPRGLGNFCWRPDGKGLIVTYRNGLYNVPVD